MRYAVYFTFKDQTARFAGSFAKEEGAINETTRIESMSKHHRAFVIEVSRPEMRVDPYAEDFWSNLPVDMVE